MADVQPSTTSLGLGQAPLVLVDPRAVFTHVAQTGRYGWTLAALLFLTTLIGVVTVQTGLIDREVDRSTQKALEQLEREQIDLLSRAELSERIENIRKTAEFTKLMKRGEVVVAAPVYLLASLMLIAAVLFAVVALAGTKPDYPTLMAVCVYSAVISVLAAALRLAMMIYYRTIDVDTSLGLLVPSAYRGEWFDGVSSAIDPFRAWFWLLVAGGLVVTGQLSRRRAAVTCLLLWLATTGVRAMTMVPLMKAGA